MGDHLSVAVIESGAAGLATYLCRHHLEWLADAPTERARVVDGSLVLLDVSGFTPLTERLAARGKAGGEELTDHLNAVFGRLVATAADFGGDVLKFGGDALFILFSGLRHECRAAAAAWDLQIAMRPFRRLRTSVGTLPLQASSGLASGPVHLFLAGDRFAELVVAGPTVTACLELEKAAEATEVLIDDATADAIGLDHCTEVSGSGLLLTLRPMAEQAGTSAVLDGVDARLGLPAILHDELAHSTLGEHRQGVVAFVQFRGVDELLAAEGPGAAGAELDALLADVQAACERHGVTFRCTDADLAAGKVMLVAGAPVAHEDDVDRMLRAPSEIVALERRLRVRAGVNRGRVFAVHLGAPTRRTYTTMGDATNLAARVMGRAPDRAVLATRAALDRARSPYLEEDVEPFTVKGKSMLIDASIVRGPVEGAASARRVAHTGDRAVPPGREPESAVIADALRTAGAGGRAAVELRGEPGIGKSRLVDHAIALAEEQGLRVLCVQGDIYSQYTAYFALREPVRELLGVDGKAERGEVAAAVRRAGAAHVVEADDWVGLLGPIAGVELELSARAARLEPDAAAGRARFAATQLLTGLVGRAALIVVEDAHWLDAATSELLSSLIAAAALPGCAVLAARRPEHGGLELADDVRPARIDLGPIPDAAARAIVVSAIRAGGGVTPDAVPGLVERAAGNPLLLHELTAALSAGGTLDALPDDIEGLLAVAIDRLAPGDRAVLRRLAVLGATSRLSTAATYLGFDRGELLTVAGRLAAFVKLDGEELHFRHALQRAAAYEALPFRVRRRLHGRAAEIVRLAAGDDVDGVVELLALHAHHAGRAAECWELARRAAERALGRGAPTDALALFDWAIEAGRRLREVDGSALGQVLESRGDAADRAGRYDDAAAAYVAARRARHDDALAVAELWRKQARMHERAGRYGRALACATRGRRALHGARPSSARDVAIGRLEDVSGTARLRQGRAVEARHHLESAVARLERTSHTEAIAHANYMLAGALMEAGWPAESEVLSERALDLCRTAGDLVGASSVLNNQGIDAYWAGAWTRASALLEQARAMRVELGDVALTAETELNLAELRSDQGHWEEAEALLTDALAIFRAAPRPEGVGLALSDLGRLAARRGDVALAATRLAEARDVLETINAAALAYEVGVREAERLVLADRPHEAIAAIGAMRERAPSVAASHFYVCALTRSEGWATALLGDLAGARRLLERALANARESNSRYEEAVTLDALAAVDAAAGSRTGPDAVAALADLGVVALARPALG